MSSLLWQLLAQVTLWLAFGVALAALARRRGPRAAAATAVWVGVGVGVLTALAFAPLPAWFALPSSGPLPAPSVDAPLPIAAVNAPAWQLGPVPVANVAPVIAAPTPVDSAPPAQPRWGWLAVTLAAGCVGGCLLRLVLALVEVRRCRRNSVAIEDADLERTCADLRSLLGVTRPVALRTLAGLGSPATLGWRQPVILLPSDWPGWNESERRAVLAHELAHIRRGDYGRWLLTLACAALHGYHPLAHWLVRGLRRDQELAADALAAGPAGGPTVYAQALCRLALRRDHGTRLGLAHALLPAHISLTRRVTLMLQGKNCPERKSLPFAFGGALLLAGACMLVAGLRQPAEADEPVTPPTATAPEPRRDLEQTLEQPVSLDLRGVSLRAMIAQLRDLTGLTIDVDEAALRREKIDDAQPIHARLDDVPLKTALGLLLRKAALDFVIADDVVQVTTAQVARARLVGRAYAVADLMVPVADFPAIAVGEEAQPAEAPDATPLEARLVKLITRTIAPESWQNAGGPGTVDYFPAGKSLVVNQTTAVHLQVADLLAALRRRQDLEVAVELRLISVNAEATAWLQKEFGVDCGQDRKPGALATTNAVCLTDRQLFQMMEKLQGDRRVAVLQTPKVTLFNGQQAVVQIQEHQWFVTNVQTVENGGQVAFVPKNEPIALGCSLAVQGVVAEDRRSVRLALDLQSAALASDKVPVHPVKTMITPVGADGKAARPVPFTQYIQQPSIDRWRIKSTVSAPDGGTVVLSGAQLPGKAGSSADGRPFLLVAATPRIVAPAPAAQRPPERADVQALLKKYNQACQAGRLDEARTLATAALKLDPTCFDRK